MNKLHVDAGRGRITGYLPRRSNSVADVCDRICAIVEALGHALMPDDDVALAFGLGSGQSGQSGDELDVPFQIQLASKVDGDPVLVLRLVERLHGLRAGFLQTIRDCVAPETYDKKLWSIEKEPAVHELDDALRAVRGLAKEIELFRINCIHGDGADVEVLATNIRKVLLSVKAALLRLKPCGGLQTPPRALTELLNTAWRDDEKMSVVLAPGALTKLRKPKGSNQPAGFSVLSMARLLDDARMVDAYPDGYSGGSYELDDHAGGVRTDEKLMDALVRNRRWFSALVPGGGSVMILHCTLVPLTLFKRFELTAMTLKNIPDDVIAAERNESTRKRAKEQNKWFEQQRAILGHDGVTVYHLPIAATTPAKEGGYAFALDPVKFKTFLMEKRFGMEPMFLRPDPTPIAGALSLWARQMALSNRHARLRDNEALNLKVEVETKREAMKEEGTLREHLASCLNRTLEKLADSSEATREELHMEATLSKLVSLVREERG